jgi:hypothetical protein
MIANGLTAAEGVRARVRRDLAMRSSRESSSWPNGGVMDRSFSRIAALVCSASAIALLAGCASAAPGAAVLGVPKSATSTAPPPSGDVLAGLEQAITNELNAVNATQSANEAPESLIELEALNNPASLLKAENFERLQALGADAAKKRELVVQALIAEVQGDSYLAKVTVGGRNLSEWMVSILNGVNSQLGALTSSLSSVELTDQVRADIISINASTRVYGLIEPMMHLALAGGDELYELATLQNREVSLAKLLSRTGSADPLYTNDQNMIADMKNNRCSEDRRRTECRPRPQCQRFPRKPVDDRLSARPADAGTHTAGHGSGRRPAADDRSRSGLVAGMRSIMGANELADGAQGRCI